MNKKLNVVVIGLGNFGYHAAREIARLGHSVIAVDQNFDKVQSIGKDVTKAVEADITRKEVLASIGLGDADLAVVSLGKHIDLSALATLYLKELGLREIWVKVVSEDHAQLMRLIGATDTIYPERDMAERVARRINYPNIVDRLSLAADLGILEVSITPELEGKSLVDLDLRRRFDVNVVAVRGAKETGGRINPDPARPLQAGEELFILGTIDNLQRLQRELPFTGKRK